MTVDSVLGREDYTLPEALAAAPRNLTRIGRAIGALTSIKNTENLHP